MATIDLDQMLDKVKGSQWALKDIDWDAPGAETITEEQWPKLRDFMIDLVWIEHVGGRGFAAMAKNAPNETLRQLYTYFHAEEQRHANVEMALMQRWGMLDNDEVPEPSRSIRLAIEWLERYADDLPYHVLGSVTPALEVALDGALCKFLLDTVDDPVCHQAFEKINDDESRHLGVGFHVMEEEGHSRTPMELVKMLAPVADPRLLVGMVVHFPLMNKMRDNLVTMGLPEQKLYDALKRFEKIGGRTEAGRRNPHYQIIARHARIMSDRSNRWYHGPVDALVKVIDRIPERMLPRVPSWVNDLTWRSTD
jgi:hypothetical protein